VRVRRLERLDLVKLDVEGAELEALRGMAGFLRRLRPRALVVEVKQRVLDRAGVDGDEIHLLLSRLGYASTGQVLPVANRVYRPAPGRAATGCPGPSTAAPVREEVAERLESSGCDLDRFVPGPGGG
jgi:hypothetical protein